MALFDVYWGRLSLEDPGLGPRDEDLRAVTDRGGEVVHEFNLPMARVLIDPAAIADLDANFARSVEDPLDQTLEVIVGFKRPFTEADLKFFNRLGGIIKSQWGFINAIYGTLPDAGIATLRSLSHVDYVEGNGVDCLR